MRLFAITGLLVLGAACSGDSQFQHRSTLLVETRGLALENDSVAQVGMYDQLCEISVASGTIVSDTNVTKYTDVVVDAAYGELLVIGENGLYHHTIGSPSWEASDPVTVDPAFVGAHLTDSGWVSVSVAGSSTVSYNDEVVVAVPGSISESTVDRSTGMVYTGGTHVYEISRDGAVAIGAGNLVSWDSGVDVLYTATQGDSMLTALEPGGDVRFKVELEGAIQDIEAMGDRGAASVMLDLGAEGGTIVMVDGVTGEVLSSLETPSVAESLTASPSGQTLAVSVNPRITHFFRVRDISN